MTTRFMPLIAILTASVVAIPARLEAQGQEAALLAAERAASELSSDSGLAAALSRAMQPAGVLLWPGAPVVAGLNNVRRLLESLPGGDSLRLVWQPLGIELAQDTTLGVTWGVAVGTGRRIPAPPKIGRYVATWWRQDNHWSIAALLFIGLSPAVTAVPSGVPPSLPPATASGPAGPFVSADLAFARLAGDSGAATAFERWAARDAMVFGGRGLLVHGPDAIAQGVVGDAVWRWHPVAAGASNRGDLGWTVGEAVIAPKEGKPSYSKYLTVWTRGNDGSIRFLTDGGSARPGGRAP
jgi:hypothetical protein